MATAHADWLAGVQSTEAVRPSEVSAVSDSCVDANFEQCLVNVNVKRRTAAKTCLEYIKPSDPPLLKVLLFLAFYDFNWTLFTGTEKIPSNTSTSPLLHSRRLKPPHGLDPKEL